MARLRIPRARRKRPNRLHLRLPTHDSQLVDGFINIAFSKGAQRPCTIVLDSAAAQKLAETIIMWLPCTRSRFMPR